MDECKWERYAESEKNSWEEVCRTHTAVGLPVSCGGWRCAECKHITGTVFYDKCPGPAHLLISLARKVKEGRPIHD